MAIPAEFAARGIGQAFCSCPLEDVVSGPISRKLIVKPCRQNILKFKNSCIEASDLPNAKQDTRNTLTAELEAQTIKARADPSRDPGDYESGGPSRNLVPSTFGGFRFSGDVGGVGCKVSGLGFAEVS